MFAIYHFLADNSAGIGKTSLIIDFIDSQCVVGSEVKVKWGKKVYQAKIIQFGESEEQLSDACAQFIRMLNKRKRQVSPVPKKQASFENLLLQRAKKALDSTCQPAQVIESLGKDEDSDGQLDLAATPDSSDKETIVKLTETISVLEKKVENLTTTIALLTGLPALLEQVQCWTASTSSSCEPPAQSTISKRSFPRCTSLNGQKYANEIMQSIYTKPFMQSHSLTGTNTHKPALPTNDVADIIDAVITKFPTETAKSVRQYIGGMLSNADKQGTKKPLKQPYSTKSPTTSSESD